LPRRATPSEDKRFYALWSAAGLLELPLAWIWIADAYIVPGWAAVAAHLAAAAAVFAAPPIEGGWTSPTRHWAEPMALWTLLIPVIGWAAAGLFWFSHDPENEPEEFFLPEEEDRSPGTRFGADFGEERLEGRVLEAIDIAPAADILISGDQSLKRSAIETFARIRTPESIGWLLKARRDSNADVRFYATAALTNLRHDYEQKLRASQREVFEKPLDPGPKLALYGLTLEYALSGLLDDDSKREHLASCRSALAALSRDNSEALRLLYRIEREIDPGKALSLLEEMERRLPSERTEWLKERARLLFRNGDFLGTRDALNGLKTSLGDDEDGKDGEEWRSTVLWWTHD
jgi:hypothetical protein